MDQQIARLIYLRNMAAMKEILQLGEFKLGGRESDSYRYFKRVVMDQFYDPMTAVFEHMVELGLLVPCSCGTNVRKGYKPCPNCNGAGYANSSDFADFVSMKTGLPQGVDGAQDRSANGQSRDPNGIR